MIKNIRILFVYTNTFFQEVVPIIHTGHPFYSRTVDKNKPHFLQNIKYETFTYMYLMCSPTRTKLNELTLFFKLFITLKRQYYCLEEVLPILVFKEYYVQE